MKITYNYGTMNSGKSMTILSMYHNYKEAGKDPVLIKPQNATRDTSDKIESRIGLGEKCEVLPVNLTQTFSFDFFALLSKANTSKSPIIIDEGQFFSRKAVKFMCKNAVKYNTELMVFGLLTDFKGNMFNGTKAWLEETTHIRETKTICSNCGKYKANHNVMVDSSGDPIEDLDGNVYPNAKYVAVCEKCYLNNLRKN